MQVLREAGLGKNAEDAVRGNLTSDDKSRYDWRTMSAAQLANIVENRYNASEQQVEQHNYAALHNNAPALPGAQPTAPAPVLTADNSHKPEPAGHNPKNFNALKKDSAAAVPAEHAPSPTLAGTLKHMKEEMQAGLKSLQQALDS